jgi:hypothetical protein
LKLKSRDNKENTSHIPINIHKLEMSNISFRGSEAKKINFGY